MFLFFIPGHQKNFIGVLLKPQQWYTSDVCVWGEMYSCHCVLPISPDADYKPKFEQATAVSSPRGGAAAEPSTSQPPKTEATAEKTSAKPDESKVHR